MHDVCMQNLPVIFAIDRAGLVGSDGETHQGIFDLSYLSLIPNITIMSPKTMKDLPKLFEWAISSNRPVAIRYPRGRDEIELDEIKKVSYGKWETICKGKDVVIIATGKMVQKAYLANQKYNLNTTIINATFIKPLDEKLLLKLIKENNKIITIEDNVLNGGLGSQISMILAKYEFCGIIKHIGFEDKFVEQGTQEELFKQERITEERIQETVQELRG